MGVTLDSFSCFCRNWRARLPVAPTPLAPPVHMGGKEGESIFLDKLTTVLVSTDGIGDDKDGWTHVLVHLKQTEMAVLRRVPLLWQLVL